MTIVVALILLANTGVTWIVSRLEFQVWPEHMEIVDRAVLIGVITYVALMATPFLPGIEVGLMLMAALGPKGVLVTYVSTIIALTLSFGIGRIFPTRILVAFVRWLNLQRAASLLERFEATPAEHRLALLAAQAPGRVVPILLGHRYLLLAVLLNLPGNALIGGGGGIAMLSGISRLYSFPAYVLVIALAVLPGPLLVMLSAAFAG